MTDFDLRGYVGIRLVDATRRDEAVVERQLGPIGSALDRPPDVTIRFVDRLPTSGPVRLIGLGEYGFDNDSFLVLRGRHKLATKVVLPLDEVGGHLQITCERGLPAVPLLMPIVAVTALANGAVPIHGSAFVHDGRGVLVAGWAKGGKTETLLAFLERGASYVGDEWVFLPGDGTIFGIPEPIRFWGWHLAQAPALAARVDRADRFRVRSLEIAADAVDALVNQAGRPAPAPVRVLSRLAPMVRRQAAVQVPPARAFPGRPLVDRAPLDHLVLAVSAEVGMTRVEPIDPLEVADRMAASVRHEWLGLEAAYLAFRFAFPARTSELLEGAAERERTLLRAALAGVPATLLAHPYPPRLRELHQALGPMIDGRVPVPTGS